MRKRTAFASVLTASAITGGVVVVNNYTKSLIYRERLDKENQVDWYSDLNGIKVKIKNHKNLYLQGYLFEEENAKQTIIGLHSLKKSSISLKPYVMFLKELFPQSNVLLYDANGHGLSDGYIRGLGYKDITDLMYFNTYVLQKYGEDHRVIMYGKGAGANTILNAASLNKLKNVDLIISEGAYSKAITYLGHLCERETKISHAICQPIISLTVKQEIKVDLSKLNTGEFVRHNNIPTIFVHSKNDKDVPFKNVFTLYNHNKSIKHLFPIVEESLTDLDFNDEYSLTLKEYVNNIYNL